MTFLSNTKERTRFIKFAIVGSIGAVVDFGIMNILTQFSLPFVVASIISFIAAVISNFLLNRYWTYPDSREKSFTQQMVQFFVISLIGLAIRTPMLAWMESRLIKLSAAVIPASFLTPEIIGHNVALAIAILVVMMWNFFANRYWTYSDVKS
jgi:putative flippase GtrA